MKFGKDFEKHLEETLPEWRDKFLCYKPLKKLLNHHHQQQDINPPNPPNNQDWFVTILNHELQKFNDFYVDKEEDFVIRLQELKERIERVRESKNEPFTCESSSEFSEEEMLEIRKAFVTIHGEMVLLKNYSSLNFAGLVKILKKFDKRTGGLLSLPFTQRALHQPFFTTEPLTGLVRQCEANLELLFPLEEEVIESSGTTPVAAAATTRAQDKYSSVDHNDQKSCNRKTTEEASSAEEEQDTHDDVYRSTLAAMKAIQCLRKASSTYNPLSLARFFHGQDDDDAYGGAVTAENSDSNCPNANQHDKDTDQDSVHLSND